MRAYVDQRVNDHDAAAHAAAVAAERWSLCAPVLIRHAMNSIFRCGEVVLRVATPNAPASLSIDLAELLAERGIAAARPARQGVVEADGFDVTCWEHVQVSDQPIDWRQVGVIVRTVHELSVEDLPVGLPTPVPTDLPWWDHEALLCEVEDLIDAEARAGLLAGIERHEGWRRFDDVVVCHGDVHPGNVIMTADGPIVLDWDLLCLAPRGWDHAPMMTWTERWGGEVGMYEALADGYGWSARGDRAGEAFAELRLVSATLMRLKVARTQPRAMAEALRRLAYWRGESGAPAWSAQ